MAHPDKVRQQTAVVNSARKNYDQADESLANATKETKNRQNLYEKAISTIKDWRHKISDLAEKVEELREVYKLTNEVEMDLKHALRSIDDLAVSSKV